jgi:predicted O-linked N-acetylglucosamine transferase (SPINDLY family)
VSYASKSPLTGLRIDSPLRGTSHVDGMPSRPEPAFADALRLHQAGQLAEAASRYEALLRQEPTRTDIFLPLALALRGLGRDAEALTALDAARRSDPSLAEAHHQAGNLFKRLGRWPEAIEALRTASQLAPENAVVWLNLGVACLDSDRKEEAIAAFERAIALEPSRPEAHNILGVALTAAGCLHAARTSLQHALKLRPSYGAAHNNLARLYKAEGLLPEAVAEYRAALAAEPDPRTHSNLLFALNFVAGLDPCEVFAEHRRWNARYAAPLDPAANPSDCPTQIPVPSWQPGFSRRLRIGYVSPDFAHHAVAYFIGPVLAAHDRARVEVFCYASVATPDRYTDRLRSLAEHWRDIARLDDQRAVEVIRADAIDLLIDLAGHTANHRLCVFARRPAAVQATWIGYPNTTGLDAIDYRITDAVSDPIGQTEHLHSERLARLPATFSCYGPDELAPAVNALPARASGAVTFGCFNNFAKISPPVITTWAQILRELPISQLLLKSRGLDDEIIRTRVRAAFADAGVAPGRISFNGEELSVVAHLGLYHGIDIALDPFPYNGTTTTCEALWMGVPVLTLAGEVHAARVGASLLTHAGLPDWITNSTAEYVQRAIAAARDIAALAELRRALRERLRTSPLCDAVAFTRSFEQTCEVMAARLVS